VLKTPNVRWLGSRESTSAGIVIFCPEVLAVVPMMVAAGLGGIPSAGNAVSVLDGLTGWSGNARVPPMAICAPPPMSE